MPDENGFPTTVTNRYVELATGMHRWEEAGAKWVEASDEIEVLEDRAVARRSAHQVTFGGNAHDPEGVIELVTPDGQVLRSRVVGLAYTESDTGRSVFLAEVKEAQGTVVGRNQVIYADAFDNGIQADLRYTTTRSSFEQDVILRQQLPSPAEYGLNPATTRLEVWTEFLDAPEPEKRTAAFKRRGGVEETDEHLGFGAMTIGPGRAFSLDDAAEQALERGVPVKKEWQRIQGGTFLIETLPYLEAKAEIDTLPEAKEAARIDPVKKNELLARAPNTGRSLPVRLAAGAERPARVRNTQIARADTLPSRPGYVLDYITVTSQSNYTFKGDTTYYIGGDVFMSGTTTLEGGAVIKYAKYSEVGTTRVTIQGPFICATDRYRPAIFTAKDDNTVGETISGSTGSPSGYYAYYALRFYQTGHSARVENLRVQHAYAGCYFLNDSGHGVANAQFVNTQYPVEVTGSDVSVRNVLMANTHTAFGGHTATFSAEHVTVHTSQNLVYNDNTGYYLTNCLLVAVSYVGGSGASYSGVNNTWLTNDAGVFQTVGAGAHYLAANSPYRNAGTTAIHPQLAADLKRKTTYPPLLLTNHFISDAVLAPVVLRDIDRPDLGYHYEPLDYIFGKLNITGATLTLTNGVAVGLFSDSTPVYGAGAGLTLESGGKLISEGRPGQLNWLVPVMAVQEQRDQAWAGPYHVISENLSSSTSLKAIKLRFTGISTLSGESTTLLYLGYYFGDGYLKDSQFYGGVVRNIIPINSWTFEVTNNLFDRSFATFGDDNGYPMAVHVANNLFRGRGFVLNHYTNHWTIYDNIFQDSTFQWNFSNPIANGHNAYINTPPLTTNNVGNVILTNFTFAAGPFGRYYHASTNLLNAGSRPADQIGLYHHTTQLNQAKEAYSTVDIGFHYPAVGPDPANLVGYWPLDEGAGTTTSDASGLGNHGAFVNSPAWTSGEIGAGLAFDGTGADDYVNIPNSPSVQDVQENNYTVSAWFKPYSIPPGSGSDNNAHYGILYKNGFHTGIRYSYNGKFYGDHWLTGNVVAGTGGGVDCATNVFHHVVMVVDKAQGKTRVYVNGGLQNTASWTAGTAAREYDTTTWKIGIASPGAGTWRWAAHGVIDDVRLYTRALSDNEVNALYQKVSAADTDNDGIPDYLEDNNGNGSHDSGTETDWQVYNSPNGLTGSPGLRVHTPLR